MFNLFFPFFFKRSRASSSPEWLALFSDPQRIPFYFIYLEISLIFFFFPPGNFSHSRNLLMRCLSSHPSLPAVPPSQASLSAVCFFLFGLGPFAPVRVASVFPDPSPFPLCSLSVPVQGCVFRPDSTSLFFPFFEFYFHGLHSSFWVFLYRFFSRSRPGASTFFFFDHSCLFLFFFPPLSKRGCSGPCP